MIVVNSRLILLTKAPLLLKRLIIKNILPAAWAFVNDSLWLKKYAWLNRQAIAALRLRVVNITGLTAVISCLLLPLSAQAHDALKMTLTSSKVVIDNQGNRRYIPVSTAKVGTLIQYRATYSNTLDSPIKNATITLPIPTSTEFNGEAYPPSAQGSIDYYNYQDIPLRRVVEGKLVDVPYSEYKSLRWNIKYIPAHKSINVAFNTVVN